MISGFEKREKMWDLQTRDEVGARMSRCLRRETESKKWERLHQRAAAGGSPRKSGKAIKKPEMISRGLMQAKPGVIEVSVSEKCKMVAEEKEEKKEIEKQTEVGSS